MSPKKMKKCECLLCGEKIAENLTRKHLEKKHPDEWKNAIKRVRERASEKFWKEICEDAGVDPPPPHLLKSNGRAYRKRYRPEKIISEREFLTGERRTKEDLPTHLHACMHGSGKRPR